MSDTPITNTPYFYLDILQKVVNHLVGITVLCYLSGFIITNLYLGSLGIVNLDLLRARYVLSGLLFLLFVGIITYLIYGLNQTLHRNRHQQPLKILLEIGRYSFLHTGLLYMLVLAMTRLAGSSIILPVGIPTLSPALPWSAWFAAAPISILRQSASNYGIVLFAILIIVLVWIAIDPKDIHGVRTTRRQALLERFRQPRRLISVFFLLFVFMYILVITSSLLDFIRLNKVTDLSSRGAQPLLQTGGWFQFFLAIVIIYIAVASVLIFRFFLPPRNAASSEDKGSNVAFPWTIYFTAIAIAVIPQLYALGIYPSIPQQLGGGQILLVSVITSSNELKLDLADPNNDIYLIDRASSNTLFLLVSKNQKEHRVTEISSSLIESITYL